MMKQWIDWAINIMFSENRSQRTWVFDKLEWGLTKKKSNNSVYTRLFDIFNYMKYMAFKFKSWTLSSCLIRNSHMGVPNTEMAFKTMSY